MPPPRGHWPGGRERLVWASGRVYRSLLRIYPRELRDGYADEMARYFRDLCREELEYGGGSGLAALWARTLPELFYTALKERRTVSERDAYRSVAGVAVATASILLIPLLVAPAWNPFDFVFAGAVLFGTGSAYVLLARRAGNLAYRAAVGVALAAALLLVWLTGAVGIIGSEDDPANLMYFGVLAVGIVGALAARLRAPGMARAMFATALVQAAVTVIALLLGSGSEGPPGVLEALVLNGFFLALFVGSALLFGYAARRQAPAAAAPEG